MYLIGNGQVITRDSDNPYLKDGAVVTEGTKILAVGKCDELKRAYPEAEFTIYDRWGKRVWHQENADELLWDASKLSDGVYYCAIEYCCRITGRKKHLIHTSVTGIR